MARAWRDIASCDVWITAGILSAGIAVITDVSGLTCKRGERVNPAVRENEPERRQDSRERRKSSLTHLYTF